MTKIMKRLTKLSYNHKMVRNAVRTSSTKESVMIDYVVDPTKVSVERCFGDVVSVNVSVVLDYCVLLVELHSWQLMFVSVMSTGQYNGAHSRHTLSVLSYGSWPYNQHVKLLSDHVRTPSNENHCVSTILLSL